MIDFDSIVPTERLHCGSDVDYQVDAWGCVTIWDCDSQTPIRISLRSLDDLHRMVFSKNS